MRHTCPEPCDCVMTHVVSGPNGEVIPIITVDCSRKGMEEPPATLPPSATTLRLEGNKVKWYDIFCISVDTLFTLRIHRINIVC